MKYILIVIILPIFGCVDSRHNYQPTDGYVPNKLTAIDIAIAIWTPIYAKDSVFDESPYSVELVNDVWSVRGSLYRKHELDANGHPLQGFRRVGGVAEIEIDKTSGKILRVSHGK